MTPILECSLHLARHPRTCSWSIPNRLPAPRLPRPPLSPPQRLLASFLTGKPGPSGQNVPRPHLVPWLLRGHRVERGFAGGMDVAGPVGRMGSSCSLLRTLFTCELAPVPLSIPSRCCCHLPLSLQPWQLPLRPFFPFPSFPSASTYAPIVKRSLSTHLRLQL